MTTYTIRSKYQTWAPWINEYHRMTLAGYSNEKAEKLADAHINKLRNSMKTKINNAKMGLYE